MTQLNAVSLGVALIVSYVIVTIIYRLYFHPLAKFPGPLWARLTTIPAWWHSKNQDRHIWLLRLQEQYGEWIYSWGLCKLLFILTPDRRN